MRLFLFLPILFCFACSGLEDPAPEVLPEDMTSLEALLDSDIGDGHLVKVYGKLAKVSKASDPAQSELYLYRQLEIAERMGSVRYQGKAHHHIGLLCKKTGRYNEAVSHYLKAVGFFHQLKDIECLGKAYNNIGNAFLQVGLYDEAIPYFEKASEFFDKAKSAKYHAIVLSNLGECHWRGSNPDFKAANDYYKEAIALVSKEDTRDHYHIFKWYNDLGGAKFESKDYLKALEYYNKALPYASKIENSDEYKSWLYLNMAESYLNMDEPYYGEAEKWAAKAVPLKNTVIDNDAFLVQRLNILGELALRQGRYQEATDTFNRAIRAIDRHAICSPIQETFVLMDQAQRKCAAAGMKVANAEIWRIADLKAEQERLKGEFEASLDREGLRKSLAQTVEDHRLSIKEARMDSEKQVLTSSFLVVLVIFSTLLAAIYFAYRSKKRMLGRLRNRAQIVLEVLKN